MIDIGLIATIAGVLVVAVFLAGLVDNGPTLEFSTVPLIEAIESID